MAAASRSSLAVMLAERRPQSNSGSDTPSTPAQLLLPLASSVDSSRLTPPASAVSEMVGSIAALAAPTPELAASTRE